jgi:hypothetical protein
MFYLLLYKIVSFTTILQLFVAEMCVFKFANRQNFDS